MTREHRRDRSTAARARTQRSTRPAQAGSRPRTNQDWWPNQLDLPVLHQHSPRRPTRWARTSTTPRSSQTLDVDALKQDLVDVMTHSQDWWPADYGHYGPLFIRMSWHAAGTYRIDDGRGGAGDGAQRFAPLNSWPDNANLDKARRLLWPVKQKYGQKISWADLLVLAGNVALESMGFETFGFGFGREDVWEPEEIFWGPEDTWLGDERYSGDRELADPLGAVQMGLIYVNPEGPNGNPDPLAAARDIRETFRRMAMNDEETVALIAGGHTFGKTHGAGDRRPTSAPSPRAPARAAGPRAGRTPTAPARAATRSPAASRAPGPTTPTQLGQQLLRDPLRLRVGADREPGRRQAVGSRRTPPRARSPTPHDPRSAHAPTMLTTDLALRIDPAYEPISRRFHENPTSSPIAFAKAWYKLLHRDMGPVSRYLGPWVRRAAAVAGPGARGRPRARRRRRRRRAEGRRSSAPGLSVSQLVSHRVGVGVDLPRHRQARRRQRRPHPPGAAEATGRSTSPAELATVLKTLERVQQDFNGAPVRRQADLAGRPDRARRRRRGRAGGRGTPGTTSPCRSRPGRTDATQEQTDVESFAVLEPTRRRLPQLPAGRREAARRRRCCSTGPTCSTLTAPEMTVLRRRPAGRSAPTPAAPRTACSPTGPATLTQRLLRQPARPRAREWKASATDENVYEGRDLRTGEVRWTATAVDLVFGSQLAAAGARRGLRQRRRRGEVRRATSSPPGPRSWTLDRFDLA